MGFDLPQLNISADARADAAHAERHEAASDDTKRQAELDARSQVESFVTSHSFTAENARGLRKQIQNIANQRGQELTRQEIDNILRPIIQARIDSHECEPEVLTEALRPFPGEQEVLPQPTGDAPTVPNPDNANDPNAALVADHGDGTDGGFARLLSGNGNEAPNPQVLTARAALLPTGAPLPPPPVGNAFQPPPPGVPLPTPKNPSGVPHDGAPQVAVGNPTGDAQVATLPGASLLPGAPIVAPLVVPGTPVEPQPRVRVMCLGAPDKTLGDEEQQAAAMSFVEARSDFATLMSTSRGPIPVPVPTTASQGETVVGRLFRQATAAKVGARGSRGGRSEGDSTATDRDLALGFRRSMGRC